MNKLEKLIDVKKNGVFLLVVASILAVLVVGKQASLTMTAVEGVSTSNNGFNQYGYNYTARIFNGTGESWSLSKGLPADYLGAYAKDKLVMKWNAEWDRGNAEGWKNPPYGAWEDNEWNGKVPGGSGAVWHYKIVWDQGCTSNKVPSKPGGYCIWGQFETIMDQGTDPSYGPGHLWFAKAMPNGYGVK